MRIMDLWTPEARRALLERAIEKAGSRLALSKAMGGSRALVEYWWKQGVPLKRVQELRAYVEEGRQDQ
jgi:transposase-like protein